MKQKTSIRRKVSLFLLPLLVCLLFVGNLAAQEFTGRVSDPTGAILAKVAVTAHNLDTNLDTSTVTTTSGDYTIPYLTPGNYKVTATAKGFKQEVHTGLILQVGQTATVNFTLRVGGTSETVTVQAEAPLEKS
jgi:hypothetical protein